MKVIFSDLRDKVLEFVSCPVNRPDDKSIPLDRKVDGRTCVYACILGERFGNPQSEAVSPLLNSRDHFGISVYTMNIHLLSTFVNPHKSSLTDRVSCGITEKALYKHRPPGHGRDVSSSYSLPIEMA